MLTQISSHFLVQLVNDVPPQILLVKTMMAWDRKAMKNNVKAAFSH
jgi:hypothetical protein